MRTSDKGIELIKQFEGYYPVAYLCSAGIPTLAWGHTKGVKLGDTCTEGQAEEWLRQDLMSAERSVSRLIKRPLLQNQFDSLASFVYNLGGGALQRSTLRQKVNRMEDAEAVAEFAKWTLAGGKRLKGLIRRRAAEAEMFAALPWVDEAELIR